MPPWSWVSGTLSKLHTTPECPRPLASRSAISPTQAAISTNLVIPVPPAWPFQFPACHLRSKSQNDFLFWLGLSFSCRAVTATLFRLLLALIFPSSLSLSPSPTLAHYLSTLFQLQLSAATKIPRTTLPTGSDLHYQQPNPGLLLGASPPWAPLLPRPPQSISPSPANSIFRHQPWLRTRGPRPIAYLNILPCRIRMIRSIVNYSAILCAAMVAKVSPS